MDATRPSLYPDVTDQPSLHHARTSPLNHSTSQHVPHSDADYEVLLQVRATLTEQTLQKGTQPLLHVPKQGLLRFIQGPVPNTPAAFHAFIALDDVNVPLLPTFAASRVSLHAFYLNIPDHTFLLDLSVDTDPALLDGTEALLRWFCTWHHSMSSDTPTSESLPPQGIQNNAATSAHTAIAHESRSIRAINALGERGVSVVNTLGTKLNETINTELERRRARIEREQEEGTYNRRQVKIGGKVTNSILSTSRKVVGLGAAQTAKLTDSLSTTVSDMMTKQASKKRSTSPTKQETSKQSQEFYDHLMAGALVFARVYVEFDRQSKLVIQDTGDRVSDIANRKYGYEAEMAARNLTGIAVDGYRISRFPEKIGSSSIVKGAFKTSFAQKSGQRAAYADYSMREPDSTPVARHPHSYFPQPQPTQDRSARGRPEFNDISEEDAMWS